jgi:hypothetical protein
MFAKLVDPGDLTPDPKLTLDQRMADAIGKLQAQQQLLSVYDAARKTVDCRGELISLMMEAGRATNVVWALVDEKVALDAKAGTPSASRESGLMKMRDGTAQLVAAMLLALGQHDALAPHHRLALAQELAPLIGPLVSRCPPTSQLEARTRLHALAEQEPDVGVKGAIGQLERSLPPS